MKRGPGATPPRPDGATPVLYTLRVEKLAAMGEAENANELLRLGSGGAGPMTARVVTEALMRVDDGSKESEVRLVAGQSYRRPPGVEHDVMNGSAHPIAFVEIEIKRPEALTQG